MSTGDIYCLDASALIHAWGKYPEKIFPSLHKKLKEVFQQYVQVPEPILDEIKKSEELKIFLQQNLRPLVPPDVEEMELLRLGQFFQTPEKNHRGLSTNDLYLIAYAQKHRFAVVTEESSQPDRP